MFVIVVLNCKQELTFDKACEHYHQTQKTVM